MYYGIVIFPSKPIQDEVNSYRKRYDPHYALIPPHITLKEAFEASDDEIETLVTELTTIANKTSSLTSTINKVSTLSPVTNTIYLKVEPIQELFDLHDHMQSGKFSKNDEYSFVPHITLAQTLKYEEYSAVFGRLQMKQFNIEYTID